MKQAVQSDKPQRMQSNAVQNNQELPVDYYLINFQQLIHFVLEAYDDLLSADEKSFAGDFLALSAPARMLYVRLLCRKHNAFRLDKLQYSEIGNLNDASAELESAGFVILNPLFSVDQASRLFTKPELIQHIQSHAEFSRGSPESPRISGLKQLKRDELENIWQSMQSPVTDVLKKSESGVRDQALDQAWLRSIDPQQENLCGTALVDISKIATTVVVNRSEHFDVFRLCFFGNLYQDMTDFVLRDLGLMRYESYVIDQNNRPFETRKQLIAHLDYFRISAVVSGVNELTTNDILVVEALLPESTDNHLERRLDRLRIAFARQLERLDEFEHAEKLYNKCTRAPARERRVRMLMKQEQWQSAFALCQDVLNCVVSDEEAQILSGLAARIARKCDIPFADPWAYKPPLEHAKLINAGDSVEQQAAEHYRQCGSCFYTENTLIDGVFGLAFWDVIFAPVRGAFFNPFQVGPADFHQLEFSLLRRDLIDEKFHQLEQPGELKRQVDLFFQQKQGIVNPMVNWRYLSEELLQLAIDRIPVVDWLAIFRRFLLDTRSNRSGLPDLIVFPDKPSMDGCRYRLVEVKGPGDSLQKNQIRWMRFFAEQGIDHAVCHVSWSDEKSPDHE